MFILSQLFSADPFRAGVDVKDGNSYVLFPWPFHIRVGVFIVIT